jgi:hypothetical protein
LDEIIDKNDDDENCADSRVACGARSCPGNGCENTDSEGDKDTEGSEKGTGKGKRTPHRMQKGTATEDGYWQWKGKVMGNGTGNGIVKQTPGGDDIFVLLLCNCRRKYLR